MTLQLMHADSFLKHYIVACGPLQCNEVVLGSLGGKALTLLRTSLASVWSGIKQKEMANTQAGAEHTANQQQGPKTDQKNSLAHL